MKKHIIFIISSLFIFPSLSFADNEINYNSPDFLANNAINYIPSVTIRGVFTGFIIRNNIFRDRDESVRYDLVEVSDPAFPLSQYPYGIVQFREPKGFRAGDFCAQPINGKITTDACSQRGVNLIRTYFSLIPTNTGAVLIKNIATGDCFSADGGGTDFPDLKKCMLAPSPSDETYKQLWFLAPAFSASGMSPL